MLSQSTFLLVFPFEVYSTKYCQVACLLGSQGRPNSYQPDLTVLKAYHCASILCFPLLIAFALLIHTHTCRFSNSYSVLFTCKVFYRDIICILRCYEHILQIKEAKILWMLMNTKGCFYALWKWSTSFIYVLFYSTFIIILFTCKTLKLPLIIFCSRNK